MSADVETTAERSLECVWKGGRSGALCPLEQMRAWCLYQVLQEQGAPQYGLHETIASKVTKIGGL